MRHISKIIDDEINTLPYRAESVIEDDDVTCYNDVAPYCFNTLIQNEKLYADLSEDTIYENIYYFQSFVDSLQKLFYRLPIWINLMLPFYKETNDAASSSNVESYFKNINQLLFCTKTGLLRVDEFIMKHTEYLSGQFKVSSVCLL